MPVAERHETYSADFEAFRNTPAFGPEWLRTARSAAFARFMERGYPTTKEEDWKFTNVAPIAATEFRRVTDGPRVTPEMLEPFLFQDRFTLQAVIVNGKLASGLWTTAATSSTTRWATCPRA